MIEKQIEAVLAAITELVNNDTVTWKEKRDMVIKAVEGHEMEFDEFLLWFDTHDE